MGYGGDAEPLSKWESSGMEHVDMLVSKIYRPRFA